MRQLAAGALALGALAMTGGPGSAQKRAPAPGPVTLHHTEVHARFSEEVGREFEIWVAHPVAGARPLPDGPRQVLYVLDADLFFGTAVEMSRLMHQLYGELPPLLVVGVAYGTDDAGLQAELRARDFTPTADSGFEELARALPGAREPVLPEGERLGGAPGFLRFLLDDVKPFIEETCDVAPDASTLFGSSLGGLFVLHAFFERPEAFDAYIAVSPAIWWGGGALFERVAALAGARDDMHARLILAVGAEEENPAIPMLSRFRMVTNVRELERRLGELEYASLEVRSFVLDGESHTSVVPAALTRGLRLAHPPARSPG